MISIVMLNICELAILTNRFSRSMGSPGQTVTKNGVKVRIHEFIFNYFKIKYRKVGGPNIIKSMPR
jgi:hypothetical protein